MFLGVRTLWLVSDGLSESLALVFPPAAVAVAVAESLVRAGSVLDLAAFFFFFRFFFSVSLVSAVVDASALSLASPEVDKRNC